MFRIGIMETSIGSRVFNVLNGRQTMKKIFVYMASAALVFAASCNKIEEANTPVDTPAETELITVELNPQTKTSLDGKSTVWTAGDKVNVTVGEEVIGTLTLVSGSTFKGEITAGLEGGTSVTLNYPVDEDGKTVTTVPATQTAAAGSFAQGAALLEGTTTVADLRAGGAAMLTNKTALLKFSVAIAGDVTFEIGTAKYTVTGCQTDKTYYACVDPANTGKLSYATGLAVGSQEKANFTSEAGKVYELGKLSLKESIFAVAGDCNSWGDTKMYETAQDNFFVLYGAEFSGAGGFKIRKAGVWEESYNFGTTTTATKTKNSVVGVYADKDSQNIKVDAATYDIYFDRLAGMVYLMEPGKSYTTATKPTNPLEYCLAGSFNSWSDTDKMTYSGDNIWTIVKTLAANNEFKVKKKNDWNENWGYNNMSAGKNLTSDSGGNVKVNSAGDYVIGFYKSGNKISLVKK